MRRLNLGWRLCWANSTSTGIFNPFQLWVSAPDIKVARVGWESYSETQTGLISYPGFQVADIETTIASTNTLGADTLTGVGVKFPSTMTDISATTIGRQLFRSGMYLKTASGTGPHFTHIRMWLDWEDC